MALVNAAVKLAQDGRRVLVVDFDLEAPGLDTFDVLKPHKEVPGVIDFVTQYLESGQSPDVSDFIGECSPFDELTGKLWIMPSGRSEAYVANFNQIDWGDLYERRDGFLLFEDIRGQWKQTLNPDYVLIDSRTGHTDTSGICTRQLPDSVVILFFPNEQNLRGLVNVVADIRGESESPRKKNIELHFVMSNVPDLDDEDRILESKIKDFQYQLGFRQEPMIVHHYDSLSLLNQVVFSKDRPKSRLAKEYSNIVREITMRNCDDRDGALEYIRRAERLRGWEDDESIREQQAMLNKIEGAHPIDGEVLFRLSVLKESHRDPESAFLLINQAIDAGYGKPEAYLKRSQIREQNKDPEGASEDAWRVLKLDQVHPTMVRGAISRLIRLGVDDLKEIVNSPAILSLDPDDKIWIANTFNRSIEDVRFGVFLLEQILDVSELSESDLLLTKYDLGLSYMALGRYSDAAMIFRNDDKYITDLDIPDAFNYAMAMWGATGTVKEEIFQYVVNLNNADPLKETPNYYQCMAIAYWAAGDNSAALEYVKQAQKAISGFRSRTELSCWRYLQVNKWNFSKDLGEIRTMIKKPGSVLPKFMAEKGKGSIEE